MYNQYNNTNNNKSPYQPFNQNPQNQNYPNNPHNSSTTSSSDEEHPNPQYPPHKKPFPTPDSLETPFDYKKTNVRLNFIRKVYLILSAQLVTTFLFVVLSFNSEKFRNFQTANIWLFYVCMVLTIPLMYALACYKKIARSVPLNYFLLFLFTIFESYVVSYICTLYDSQTVLIAAGLTAAIVVALTLYAIFTKTDFTTCGGILVVCCVALFVGGIIGIWVRNKWFRLIMAILGVIVFGIYLVYDTQLTIGKNKNKYSVDDYIMAALNLYIDIIQIFLELLKILAIANN